MMPHSYPELMAFRDPRGRLRRVGLARWSVIPPRTAVVFVHGFGGKAIETWKEFEWLLSDHRAARATDLLFYEYESRRQRIHYNASEFHDFLSALLSAPYDGVFQPSRGLVERPKEFRYSRIVLAAHSTGAAVARIALLEVKNPASTLHRVCFPLVLFAPAHKGPNIIELGSLAISSVRWLAVTESIIKWKFPTLMDLRPESDTMVGLQTRTQRAIKWAQRAGHDPTSFIARSVIHAAYDPVVEPGRFCSDPELIPAGKGTTHQSVCKPTPSYPLPVDEVARNL